MEPQRQPTVHNFIKSFRILQYMRQAREGRVAGIQNQKVGRITIDRGEQKWHAGKVGKEF